MERPTPQAASPIYSALCRPAAEPDSRKQLTLGLFRVGVMERPAVAVVGSVLLAVVLLVAGDWRLLAEGQVRLPVLTYFLLGESLVWTAYGKYMSPPFRVGIYVFHIAGASFFHYLSSYFYARGRGWLTRPVTVVGVNITFLCAGYAVAHVGTLGWASIWLAPEWFTLWVALHLVASDLFPWWRRLSERSTAEVQVARERI